MDDDFLRGEFGPRKGRDNLFGWTVFILLLIGFAMACWLGSYYIFGHPENARSYSILKKLDKIDPPKRFELTAAPAGEFLNPQKLYDRYSKMNRYELERENKQLLRNYINNYQDTKKLVPYVTGRFNILDSYELKPENMFSPGVVAVAQAAEFPQVLIEHVYTSEAANVPVLQKMLMTGLDIKLERTLDLSAVIHIEKIFDGRLQLTVVPLLYGSYALKQGSGSFSLQPPTDLNVGAGVPIVKSNLLQDAFRTFADFKKSKGSPALAQIAQPAAAASASPASAPEIVRVDPPPAVPETATPAPAASPAIASASPAQRSTASPAPALAMNATPRPSPVARPSPAGTPAAATSPAPVSPEGVPLQPFIVSAPTPGAPPQAAGGSWRVFPPGQMPRGRVVEVPDVTELAERGVGGERLYLRGEFVVTASGENRAVLRSQESLENSRKPGSGAARIIVEFPSGAQPPGEGSSFNRNESRPFQITDVRRGADGQVNVYVREITSE
jgi:hypothetical protein